MTADDRPRVYQSGGQIRLTCRRGHYLTAIDRRDWAGSLVESMAGRPVRCRDCEALQYPTAHYPIERS